MWILNERFGDSVFGFVVKLEKKEKTQSFWEQTKSWKKQINLCDNFGNFLNVLFLSFPFVDDTRDLTNRLKCLYGFKSKKCLTQEHNASLKGKGERGEGGERGRRGEREEGRENRRERKGYLIERCMIRMLWGCFVKKVF